MLPPEPLVVIVFATIKLFATVKLPAVMIDVVFCSAVLAIELAKFARL
jgi:hypothetical protein